MGAQSFVARGEVLTCVLVQIAQGGRQTVASMLAGNSTESPERVLQALGKGDITFAAEDHMGVLKSGSRQGKMIEPVIQNHTGDADLNIAHLGEVRQAQPSRLVDLRKDDFPWRPIERPPGADPALQVRRTWAGS